MIIEVKVVPRAKKEKIEKFGNGLKVWLKEPAEKGRANQTLIKKLADYFGVSAKDIQIISGLRSSKKLVKMTRKKTS